MGVDAARQSILTHVGRVERGAGQGVVLGFPTANLVFYRQDISGTYAGQVTANGREYRSAVYVDQARRLLEAYLFDFSGDLYGQTVTVQLFAKVSTPLAFTHTEALRAKIRRDIEAVTIYFQR